MGRVGRIVLRPVNPVRPCEYKGNENIQTETDTIERNSIIRKLALLLVVVFAVVANASAVNVMPSHSQQKSR